MIDFRKRQLITDNLLALAGVLVLISLAVVLVLNFRDLYYFEIPRLGLSERTGLSESVIRENYDCLIDYNLIWKRIPELRFPDFPMSEGGRIHFSDVRRIFFLLQFLAVPGGLLWILAIFFKIRSGDFLVLRLTAVWILVLPAAAGLMIAVNWESFFIGFHKVFFRNDYWLFNPLTDPVIDILPDTFFMHCAVIILVLSISFGALCEGIFRCLRKGGSSRN